MDSRIENLRALRRRVVPYLPGLLASSAVGWFAMRAILQKAGGPAAPLDDAFIHLQFAKRLAEGHFFSFVDGEGYSSGATSFLWPVLLAPFYKLGLRGSSLVYATWILGTLAHAGVSTEAARVTWRLAGRAAAGGVFAMCTLFGAFAWFAWSGMETMALAWIFMRAARLGGAFAEARERGPRPSTLSLCVAGIIGPLIRPEGLIASLIVALALAVRPARPGHRARLLAFVPLAGPLIVPLLNRAFTGHAAAATTQVKWMLGNPYHPLPVAAVAIKQNLRLLASSLLDGGDWTAIFLPEHASIPLALGLVALPIAALRRRAPFHALFVVMVALGTVIPATYLSFLWNRVRYIWPFAGAWFVLIGCLARELGDLARRFGPRLTFVTPVIGGVFAGALAMKLPWTLKDLATSASAIDRQQVHLGKWASEHLPQDARIGVNDTGAIAYFSNRKTFDVVGLTTEGEARYWVQGAGSRFEHYEKMPRERLPTHFIVYPNWMACWPVLGNELTRATVTDQSILGGATMIAFQAHWDLLGSGALPAHAPPNAELVDEVDVADLESEAAHRFEVAGGSDGDDRCEQESGEEDGKIADGGRHRRLRDRFTVTLPAGRAITMVARASAGAAADLAVAIGGKDLGTITLPAGKAGFVERTVELGALAGGPTAVTVESRGRTTETGGRKVTARAAQFASFHYWFYAAK